MVVEKSNVSSAILAIIPRDLRPPRAEIAHRPEPPADLTLDQAAEWRTIVESRVFDWLRPEVAPLLAQYCRHIVGSRRVAILIQVAEKSQPFDISEYDVLLKMHEREGRAMASLALKLRLTEPAGNGSGRTW